MLKAHVTAGSVAATATKSKSKSKSARGNGAARQRSLLRIEDSVGRVRGNMAGEVVTAEEVWCMVHTPSMGPSGCMSSISTSPSTCTHAHVPRPQHAGGAQHLSTSFAK